MRKNLLFGIIFSICCLVTACGKTSDVSMNTDSKLKWLLPANIEEISKVEEELVEQELGKFFEDMNIEIDLCFVDEKSYVEQITKILQTDQDWDIMFLNQELNQVMRNETKKFFAPITEILQTEQAQLYEAIPEYAWDVMTVNKEIFAIPNRHLWAAQEGYYVRADYFNEYGKGLKTNNMNSFDRIEDFLKKVTYNEACIGTYIPENQWSNELLSHEFYFSGDLETLGVIREGQENYIVENMFETPEFEAYCHRMRNWYKDGYIREDSAIRDANTVVIAQDRENGLFAMEPVRSIMPEMESAEYAFEPLPISEIVISPNNVSEYATAFSVNSEHLSEAMAVTDRIYHDEKIYNTILYGIEGKHYEKVSDRQIKKIEDSGYGPNDAGALDATVLGNQYLSYVMEEEAYDRWEKLENWEKEANVPATMGFVFRTANVSDEIRNVSAIIASDLRLLETGCVDVNTFLPEFQAKLQDAGANRIIAEYQVQLTRWINNKSEY